MRPWLLIAPDWGKLDTIWRSQQPFPLWPVCEKTLLSYWLDEAVRQGVPSLSIEAVDRPDLIRNWLDKRDLWSRSIEVHSEPGDREDRDCFILHGLPYQENLPSVESAKDLMQRWYELQVESLKRRSSEMVHLDHEYRPGIWFGPGVRASADVIFTPPCWVGSYANIGPGCRVGPEAFIGSGVFLDEDVEIESSIVCEDTYVGSHTSLKQMAVQGGLLIDIKRGFSIEVVDDFVLASLGSLASKPILAERILAYLIAGPLEMLAGIINNGVPPLEKNVHLSRSQTTTLRTYKKGPLCLRRSAWLRLVASGKMRLVGVLPRDEEDWEKLTPETRSAIEKAPVGVFALSDLYRCHSPKESEEWRHAFFQAGVSSGRGQDLVFRSILKLACTVPHD